LPLTLSGLPPLSLLALFKQFFLTPLGHGICNPAALAASWSAGGDISFDRNIQTHHSTAITPSGLLPRKCRTQHQGAFSS